MTIRSLLLIVALISFGGIAGTAHAEECLHYSNGALGPEGMAVVTLNGRLRSVWGCFTPSPTLHWTQVLPCAHPLEKSEIVLFDLDKPICMAEGSTAAAHAVSNVTSLYISQIWQMQLPKDVIINDPTAHYALTGFLFPVVYFSSDDLPVAFSFQNSPSYPRVLPQAP
jgi:hypothetical protein